MLVIVINIVLIMLLSRNIYRGVVFGKEWGLVSPSISKVIWQERIGLLLVIALLAGTVLFITSSKRAGIVNSVASALVVATAVWTAISGSTDVFVWRDVLFQITPVVALSITNIVLCSRKRLAETLPL